MEKLFVSAMNYINKDKQRTKFIALRYGNVLGSSGSVVPKFIEQIKSNEKITITDPSMTRFSLTMDEALDFIINATLKGHGGEIFVPKLRSYSILDLKDSLMEIFGKTEEKITNIRPGEKLHEVLINKDEMKYAWEFNNNYIIFSPNRTQEEIQKSYPGIKKIDTFESYSSDQENRIPIKELKNILNQSGFVP
jgi:UDP-N-acetylglucosamine 4,6-dehydratase/UDP-glucose 4-epimerase